MVNEPSRVAKAISVAIPLLSALAGAYLFGYEFPKREARIAALTNSSALVAKHETAYPTRQGVYGLDEDGNGSIDHIVHVVWKPTLLLFEHHATVRDYHAEDPAYDALIQKLKTE